MHGRFRRRHRVLEPDGLGGVPGLDRSELGFQPPHHSQPFQTDLVPALQHIHNSTGAGSCIQPVIFEEQRTQTRDGGVNALHPRCGAKLDSHRNIF